LHLVIGLGNPGFRYAPTRHNLGFMVVDWLASRGGVRWIRPRESHSEVAELELGRRAVLLAKPQTYMNQSGAAVLALSQQWAVTAGDMLVVFDDFLLDFGRMRFRRGGSDGGHNGLASVLERMRTQDVPRLRLGIGSPSPGADVIDYVLSPFGVDEAVEDLVARGGRAIEFYLEEGIEAAMNRFNGC